MGSNHRASVRFVSRCFRPLMLGRPPRQRAPNFPARRLVGPNHHLRSGNRRQMPIVVNGAKLRFRNKKKKKTILAGCILINFLLALASARAMHIGRRCGVFFFLVLLSTPPLRNRSDLPIFPRCPFRSGRFNYGAGCGHLR